MKHSTSYRLYVYFTAILLGLVAFGVYIAFDFLATLFATSVPINSVIVTTVIGSILLTTYYIVSVWRDNSLLIRFANWCDNPEENTDFDPQEMRSSQMGIVLRPLIKSIHENGNLILSSSSESRSIAEWLEQSFSSRDLLVAFLGGFLVLLGLLGTFLGLTITLQSMGDILTTLASGLSGSSDSSILKVMVQLIVQLQEPMAGMGTAFSTSLFGLAGSGFIGILSIILSRSQDALLGKLESWLNSKVGYSGNENAANAVSADGQTAVASGGQDLSGLLQKIGETNKFLLEMTILQQRTAESLQDIKDQSTELNSKFNLNNELSGRLLQEYQQLSDDIKQSIAVEEVSTKE